MEGVTEIMKKYSYPQPTDYSRCLCGFSRKQNRTVTNGCKLHTEASEPVSDSLKDKWPWKQGAPIIATRATRQANDSYSLRDDGRNDDGTGESYAERNV